MSFNYSYCMSSNIFIQLCYAYLNTYYLIISCTIISISLIISSINKQQLTVIINNEQSIHNLFRMYLYGSPYVYGIKQDNNTQLFMIYVSYVCLILILGIALEYNNDSIRESISSYDIVSYQMLWLLLIFILSENMFIVTSFWSSISALYSSLTTSYNQTNQDHITQVTNELTSTNTVLLSNCSLSLGSIFMINETHLLGYHINISGILISHLFSSCQIKEYQYLSLLMNESLTVTEFFILIGIHLCHIIVGIILITIYL